MSALLCYAMMFRDRSELPLPARAAFRYAGTLAKAAIGQKNPKVGFVRKADTAHRVPSPQPPTRLKNADAREEVDIGAFCNGPPREEVGHSAICQTHHPGGGGLCALYADPREEVKACIL